MRSDVKYKIGNQSAMDYFGINNLKYQRYVKAIRKGLSESEALYIAENYKTKHGAIHKELDINSYNRYLARLRRGYTKEMAISKERYKRGGKNIYVLYNGEKLSIKDLYRKYFGTSYKYYTYTCANDRRRNGIPLEWCFIKKKYFNKPLDIKLA